MGSQLATNKPDYQLYIGGTLETNYRIAVLNALEKLDLIPDDIKEEFNIAKALLQQMRIAEFGALIDNYTKLAVALGDTRVKLSESQD